MKRSLLVIVFYFAQLLGLRQLAQAAGSPCNSPNGSLFNLEPRPNAVVQVARSIATLPNPAGNNNLVVAVGADARGLECTPKMRQVIKGPATLNGGEQCWCPDKNIPVN